MGFAGAGRAQEDDVVFGGQEVELAEVEHERFLDRALEAEVELLECFAGGEAGLLDPALAAVRVPRCDFRCEQRFGETLVAPLLGARPLGQLGQRVCCRRGFQRPEQVGELGLAAHAGISAS
jgi:hypothetical protein